jgi:hypothetical protein
MEGKDLIERFKKAKFKLENSSVKKKFCVFGNLLNKLDLDQLKWDNLKN